MATQGYIDVHTHHLPAPYMDLLRRADGPTFGAAHDETTLQKMIEGQDQIGTSGAAHEGCGGR